MLAEVFGKGLNHRIALYIPSTVDVDQALDGNAAEQITNRALRFLSEMFGGATALPALGSWVSEDGKLVTENVTIVYSFSPRLTRAAAQTVHQFAVALKAELKQEAFAVEIDGKLFIV